MKLSTGINKIDNATEGGFEKGSNIILYGPPMSGKSLFTTQFAINAILNDEVVIFVTTNETYEQINTVRNRNVIYSPDCSRRILDSNRREV